MDRKSSSKTCVECGGKFLSFAPATRYCSKSCGQSWRYKHKKRDTNYQYSLVSGNWKRYYQRRVGEKKRKTDGLTAEMLLELHEKQGGKCALTGIRLTCNMVRGERCLTNASLDRIEAGGPYSIDNIQLVCSAVNLLRVDMTLNDFIGWCRKVVEHDKEKNHGK